MIAYGAQEELFGVEEVQADNAKTYNVVLWHEAGREHNVRSVRVDKTVWRIATDDYVRVIVERTDGTPRDRVVILNRVVW